MDHQYRVYIVASLSGTLYIGVTSNLERRVWEHKNGRFEGFSSQHHCDRLVYCEEFSNVLSAIAREKQLKGWRRSKKVALIESKNLRWADLAEKCGRWRCRENRLRSLEFTICGQSSPLSS
jgi:putative endonuclease